MNKKVKFVAHDHYAKRAGYHQDLRFQLPNNPKIWASFAVPKGIPLEPGTKVLAIRTHDHTKEEALMQGDIPSGEYGGGTLIIFDEGICRIDKFASAHIAIVFQGRKIKGLYHFISVGNIDTKKYKQQQYMLFKSKMKIEEPLTLTDKEKAEFAKQAKSVEKIIRGKIT
jgi:DNA ligase D-like protein (predicted 3'-phosphoesterase)